MEPAADTKVRYNRPMFMKAIHEAFIADTARVLGEVHLGKEVSIWFGAVVRGDVALISIADGSNVQDNAVVHCDKDFPNIIGAGVTIAHGAIVHGESVGDGSMIGIGAKVLGHSNIGKGCIIAAGALVPQGMVVPDGMVVMGVPGKVVRPTSDNEKEYLLKIPPRYVEVARRYATQPEHPLARPWLGNP